MSHEGQDRMLQTQTWLRHNFPRPTEKPKEMGERCVCLSHPTYYLLNLPCIPERYMMRTELGESSLTFLLNLERGTLLPILFPLQLRNSGNSS